MTYKYQFTSTAKDLLEADDAERTAKSLSAPFRWLLAAFGLAWLIIGIMAFEPEKPLTGPLIWIIIGLALVYFYAVKPFFSRAQIKSQNPGSEDIELLFSDDSLKIKVGGREFTRRWEEFTKCIQTRKGILFYFKDQTANWMPGRVFQDAAERTEFISFVQGHVTKK